MRLISAHEARLYWADFRYGWLDHADLTECDLEGACIHRTSMDGTQLRGANRKDMRETDAPLARAEDFKIPEIEETPS